MVSLFISHSALDDGDAARICRRLDSAGLTALFLDFDPARGIPGGRRWEGELYAQLRRCDAVVFLASEASVASRWCFAELCLARSLDKPIFTLRLAGVALGLISDTQWIGLHDEEAAVTQLIAGLEAAGLKPTDTFTWDRRRTPYPGLASFAIEDAAVFCGRDNEIDELDSLLHPTLHRGVGRCVALVGPSGSGKSSLLHAGLLPRLRRRSGRWIVLPPMVPGPQPLANLGHTLRAAVEAAGDTAGNVARSATLNRGEPDLAEVVGLLSGSGQGRPGVVLVVDQAEELMTVAGVGEQRDFIASLDCALQRNPNFWVVIAVRSEFLSSDPERAGLATLIRDVVMVEPMSRDRLPEVIRTPALRAGVEFAPGLVQRIADDARGGDALPLLAYTLRELYQDIGPRVEITEADYVAVGGVVGALRRRADRLVNELTRAGYGTDIFPTLLQLASIDGDGEPVRRRVRRSDLTESGKCVTEGFTEARLLIGGTDAGGQATVEVAHEALLRQWVPLRDEIEKSRASLKLRSELDRLATDWDRAQNDNSYLLRGARLAAMDEWATGHRSELPPLVRKYVEASRLLASTELRHTRRSNRRLKLLATGLSIFLAAALALTVTTVALNRTAQSEARRNLAGQLAAQSSQMAAGQPEAAILLGLQSLSAARDEDPPPLPPAGLITALAQRTHSSKQLLGHTGAVSSVAFAPDGGRLASAGQDGTVRLWTPAGEPLGPPMPAETGELSGVAFSPQGDFLAAAGQDGEVRVWRLPDLGPPMELIGPAGAVFGVAFSPDNRLLAAAGEDGMIHLWDVTTWQPHGAPLTGHTAPVYRLAFSPDSQLLASASWDTTVRLWAMPSGANWGGPLLHDDEVQSVAFSPDGRLLTSTGTDKLVRLWAVQPGPQTPTQLVGHEAEVHGAEFSPDGSLLVTTDTTGVVRMWDVPRRQPHGLPLTGHTGSSRDVSFSPDGTRFATASWDGTIRIWGTADQPSVSRPLVGHGGEVLDASFSPDGRRLATAGADDTVQLWDTRSGEPDGAPLIGHTDDVYTVAVSPDGTVLASAGVDMTVRLWDVATRRERGPSLTGPTSWIYDLTFSSDGKLLAAASEDHQLYLWDIATGAPHGAPLEGHTQGVLTVHFSPDGALLASAGADRTVRLWETATGRQVGEFGGHTDFVNSVAFDPAGTLLASASQDKTIRVWDLHTRDLRYGPITGHTAAVVDVSFSPDGRQMASASADASLRIWDAATGSPFGQPLTGHTGPLTAASFSPDGHTVATASEDHTARLWKVDFTDWIGAGCAIVGNDLSAEAWRQFLGARPYERTCPGLPAGVGAPADAPAAQY